MNLYKFHTNPEQLIQLPPEKRKKIPAIVWDEAEDKFKREGGRLKYYFDKEDLDTISRSAEYSYKYAKNLHDTMGNDYERFFQGERAIAKDPVYAYLYTRDVLHMRFPEGEAAIMTHPVAAAYYAESFLGTDASTRYKSVSTRWPEAEANIATDGDAALYYAQKVIKGRWPEGEEAIGKNVENAEEYVTKVIRDRFPAGEAILAKNPAFSVKYAKNYINGRFPEAEPYIIKSLDDKQDEDRWDRLREYMNIVRDSGERWKEVEPKIVNNPFFSYPYARHIIKGRWPEAEEEIAKSSEASDYAQYVIKGRWPEAEKNIASSAYQAIDYSFNLLNRPWSDIGGEAETHFNYTLSDNYELAKRYAKKFNEKHAWKLAIDASYDNNDDSDEMGYLLTHKLDFDADLWAYYMIKHGITDEISYELKELDEEQQKEVTEKYKELYRQRYSDQ